MLELAFRPDPARPEPLYEQLASYLAGLVEAGRMIPGERLPATRELAAQLEISRNTICHAFQVLTDRHVLVSHVGQGTFVAARPLRAIDGGLVADVDPDVAGAPRVRGFAWDGLVSDRAGRIRLPMGVSGRPGSTAEFDFGEGRVDP